MIDCIIGKDGEIYAVIDYSPDAKVAHYFRGKIVDYVFTDELAALVDEYVALVDGMALSLLDDMESEIYGYGLRLKEAGVKIFGLEIKNKTDIVFFDKYPTGKGFLDEF
ncbi:hypothetical protein PQQ51_12930 [Paraburkholderia xenovorans]|uniref:hypothetical protein n=1 Tax=Paraburkholderia xenovorans TaxID=36873 RepID=UPI0038B8E9A8